MKLRCAITAGLALIALASTAHADSTVQTSTATPTSPSDGAVLPAGDVVLRWATDVPEGAVYDLEISDRPETSYDGGPFLSLLTSHDLNSRARADLFNATPGHYYWHVRGEACTTYTEFSYSDSTYTDCHNGAYGPVSSFYILDTLSRSEAVGYMRKAMRSELNKYWELTGLSCRRQTLLRAYCKGAAWIGDVSVSVKGSIYYESNPEDNLNYYHYRLAGHRYDEYCLATHKKHRNRCVKRISWRA